MRKPALSLCGAAPGAATDRSWNTISGVWGEGSGATPSCSTTERRGGIVKVKVGDELMSSGLESLGAFVGDNSSLNTGAKVMPGRKIGPSLSILRRIDGEGALLP